MLSATLQKGLSEYAIGGKIRALRLKKKLGLVEFGKHTGLSPALLSKIERGRLFPTLPTLLRIALVFGVGLDHFFAESTEPPGFAIIRKKDRLKLPDRPKGAPPSYWFESLDFPVTDRKMEAYYAEFPPDAPPSEPHRHEGVELIYIIRGQLALQLKDTDLIVLHESDAIYFESGVSHSYRR